MVTQTLIGSDAITAPLRAKIAKLEDDLLRASRTIGEWAQAMREVVAERDALAKTAGEQALQIQRLEASVQALNSCVDDLVRRLGPDAVGEWSADEPSRH